MKIDKSKMVASTGRAAVQGIFIETGGPKRYALYTMKDHDIVKDGVTYYSLKQLYLNYPGITPGDGEYEFVQEYLVSWKQWQAISATKCRLQGKPMNEMIQEWRDELAVKVRCRAIAGIVAQSDENYQAQKWLADKGFDLQTKGRPKKADVAKAAKEEADMMQSLEDDWGLIANDSSAAQAH